MSLDKSLEQLTEEDLRQLIESQVPEGKSIDYKLDLPSNSDGDRKEFLADVSSFANTNGGHIVFGMKEKGGIPTDLLGLECENWDELIRAYDNILRDAIEPRIMEVHLRAVPLSSGRSALVIRIPKSWTQPHMVTFKTSNKFYARNSAGKYLLDVGELRRLFTLSETLAEKIRAFRRERLSMLLSQESPVPVSAGSLIVLHIVPFSFQNPDAQVDFSYIKEPCPPQPFNVGEWDDRFNFDGFLTYSQYQGDPGARTYLQIFRSGIIEAVDAKTLAPEGQGKKFPVYFEKMIIDYTSNYLKIQEQLGVSPPLVMMLSLVGIKDYIIQPDPTKYFTEERRPIDRDHLLLPEIVINSYKEDVPRLLRPAFDAIWNASGWTHCVYYESKGNWTLKD